MFKFTNWLDRFFTSETTNTQKTAYSKILGTLNRSANIFGKDSITVKYSRGNERNSLTANNVIINPDTLLLGTAVNKKQLEDVLGITYLFSILKNTVSPECYDQYTNAKLILDRRHTTVKANEYTAGCLLFQGLETGIARSILLQDWAGLSNHVKPDHTIKETIEYKLHLKASWKALCEALAWNMIYPKDSITIPRSYHKAKDIIGRYMGKIKTKAHWNIMLSLGTSLVHLFPDSETERSSLEDYMGSMLGDIVENKSDETLADLVPDSDNLDNGIGFKQEEEEDDAQPFKASVTWLQEVETPETKRTLALCARSYDRDISAIQKSLDFLRCEKKSYVYGLTTGDIDDSNLYKVSMKDPRLFYKKDVNDTYRVGVLLLVDESGSMIEKMPDTTRVLTTLGLALAPIEGISLCIYGFNSDEEKLHDTTIREYYSPRYKHLSSICNMRARRNNLDGFALNYAHNKFFSETPDCDRRMVFVLSDGYPEAYDYWGPAANDHMSRSVKHVTKQGTEVYGIGMCNAFTQDTGVHMYGTNKFIILPDVESSGSVISRFIKQTTGKA